MRTPIGSSDLVPVSTFRSMADAHVAQGVLEAAEIESMIRSDNAGGMYPAISGAELLVRKDDLALAAEALKESGRKR